ncbi:histidine kinase [Aeromicrobium sp. IC_218]|uniref:sensor histidine kinase n=1 Tax=Aeromicrobium sp. IC_218 TaxID=2545468 RepID=UPI00103A3564|nr:histidine kinase [Aeromicrobium sp. IC_218]TCI96858.1 sensor histidine kinase [Aeromicrobium sp. IC_218]
MTEVLLALGVALVLVLALLLVRRRLAVRGQALGSPADRATYLTLHRVSLTAPALRSGLTRDSARTALPHLRALLGTPTVGLAGPDGPLAWVGPATPEAVQSLVDEALATGSTQAGSGAVVAPLSVDDRVVGALVAAGEERAGVLRATTELARWMSGQLELAELDQQRTALMAAELRALRAQISPHFVYNSLAAIASFVRTDPERARSLLLEFADFTRYSFRRHGDFTTLAEELRSIEQYLVLEKARFGDRLRVVTRVAPEVLNVTLPFLCVQPLVENAVRHGLAAKPGTGTVTVEALDEGAECVITIEDDGVGVEAETVRRALSGQTATDSVGLGNVDERMRTVYGNEYGIVVETAPGLGTKVTMRVPKFSPAVEPGA